MFPSNLVTANNLNYTVNKKDPTVKKKKNKKKGAGAGGPGEEDPFEAMDWKDFPYEKDPELLVGYPNADEKF